MFLSCKKLQNFNSDNILDSIQYLIDFYKNQKYNLEKIYAKAPYQISNLIYLVEDFERYKHYEQVLSKGNVGRIIDIELNYDLKFMYLVQFPIVYFNGSHQYGIKVPEEAKVNFYSDFCLKNFSLPQDAIALYEQDARLFP